MKVILISDAQTKPKIFAGLAEALKKQILDVEVQKEIVPFADDIPAKVHEAAEGVDLVFVFVLYAEENFKVKTLLEKLIDVDMRKKAKIVKVVEESEAEGMSEFELEDYKRELVDEWAGFIINYLFHPEKLESDEEG